MNIYAEMQTGRMLLLFSEDQDGILVISLYSRDFKSYSELMMTSVRTYLEACLLLLILALASCTLFSE